jgi:hypothetical protein
MGIFMRSAAFVLAVGFAAGTASAQFNVDFSSTGAASPAPGNSYGAASGQSGFWNNFTSATVVTAPLLDVGGSATAVTLTLASGGFMFDGSNSNPNGVITPPGSDDEFFMDDVWDAPANGFITLGNLPAGAYQLYVYGGSPDSATTFMNFIVGADSQFVGGQWTNPFTFQQGVTHALFNVNHPGGDLTIFVPDVPGFESVNGLQVIIPEPASMGLLLPVAAALLRRRR